jgi:hypothetical protein
MASPQRQRGGADAGHNPNVFDDEYAVDVPETELEHQPLGRSASQGVDTLAQTRSRTRSRSRAERRSVVNDKENVERSPPQRAWRNSVAKAAPDFASVGSSAATRTPNSSSGMRDRPTSTASDFAYFEDRSSTPVHGRHGSGQGYGQFSQSGLPRSSFASSSTPRRPSVYTQTRPTNPYGLYNQSGLSAEDDHASDVAAPVGFPGSNGGFERRIGPDGEEQDIIGPDGHTEALPPYSRYPDGDTKVATATVAAVPAGAQVLSPILPGPTSPVVASQRTPGLDSATQVGSSDSRESSMNEKKAWKDKTFIEKRRTRVCFGCIPLWMLVTTIIVIVLCGAIIGGVVGGLLVGAEKR